MGGELRWAIYQQAIWDLLLQNTWKSYIRVDRATKKQGIFQIKGVKEVSKLCKLL